MTTEQRILKQILENEGEAPVQFIAKKLGLGNGYIKYLCEILFKKNLVKNLKNKNWYKITKKGRLAIGEKGSPARKQKKRTKITKKRLRKPGRKIRKRINRGAKKMKTEKRLGTKKRKAKKKSEKPGRRKKTKKKVKKIIRPHLPPEIQPKHKKPKISRSSPRSEVQGSEAQAKTKELKTPEEIKTMPPEEIKQISPTSGKFKGITQIFKKLLR